jgi:hypothetical protein
MSNCVFKGCFTQKDGPVCKYNVINYPFYCAQLNQKYQSGVITTSILTSIKELNDIVGKYKHIKQSQEVTSGLIYIIQWFLDIGLCKENHSKKYLKLSRSDKADLLQIKYKPSDTKYRISGMTGAEFVNSIEGIRKHIRRLIGTIINRIMPIVSNKSKLVAEVAQFLGYHRKLSDRAQKIESPYLGGVYRGWYIGLLQALYTQSSPGVKRSITWDLKYYTTIIQIAKAYKKHEHDVVVALLATIKE